MSDVRVITVTGDPEPISSIVFTRERVGISSEKYTLKRYGEPVSYGEVLSWLKSSSPFRHQFIKVLQAVEFSAYLFECPAVSRKVINEVNFEFVVTDSPSLARQQADEMPFKSHFNECTNDVTSFISLGGDARLVVPCPALKINKNSYTHLGQFVRYAPTAQVEKFWESVSTTLLQRLFDSSDALDGKDLWLSTNGNGVSWLHIRLDSFPKYYAYSPFKHPTLDEF